MQSEGAKSTCFAHNSYDGKTDIRAYAHDNLHATPSVQTDFQVTHTVTLGAGRALFKY